MDEDQIIEELGITKTLCEQVDSLFERATRQGRMFSRDETLLADELSTALVKQIRKLPRELRSRIKSPPLQLKAGETLDMVRLALRKIVLPTMPTESTKASRQQIKAYTL